MQQVLLRYCHLLLMGLLPLLPHCQAELKEKPLARVRLPSGSYTLVHQARPRRYHVHLPQGREHDTNLPVLFVLHGAPGHGANMAEQSGLVTEADHGGFIVVFPDGTSAADPLFLNWNSGSCCGYAWENKVDDVGFLRELANQVLAEYEADRTRVFAAGFSKGGMMAYQLACRAADTFSGIAVVAGAFNLSECSPARPLDVLIVHGRADKVIAYGTGMPRKLLPLADWDNRPLAYAVHFWKRINHCQPGLATNAAGVETREFDCFRAALRVLSLDNEGHTWPGAGPGLIGAEKSVATVSAAKALTDFFALSNRAQAPGSNP